MQTANESEARFRQNIIENPEDDGLRLIYADWLEDSAGEEWCGLCDGAGTVRVGSASVGYDISRCDRCNATGRVSDGRMERAEVIRSPHALRASKAGLGYFVLQSDSGDDILEFEAMVNHFRVNYDRLCETIGCKEAVMRRGFLDEITWTASDFLQHADDVLARHPVQTVRLTTVPEMNDRYPNDPGHAARWSLAGRPQHEVVSQSRPKGEKLAYLLRLNWPRITFHLPE